MTERNDDLRARQFAFAAHLRDEANPPPPGIEPRRMAVYRELFFNTLESLLAANFPVIRVTLGDADWRALVAEFHRDHRCATPLFSEVGEEFIAWLCEDDTREPRWLPELAHYEWMELRAQVDDATPAAHDPQGDVLSGVPVLCAQAWPLAYAWPVNRIGPTHSPAQPPDEPTLVLVRRDAAMQVHFARLSPLAFRLLALIAANTQATGEELLRQLATEAGMHGDATFAAEARAMLQQLRAEGTVIGTRNG